MKETIPSPKKDGRWEKGKKRRLNPQVQLPAPAPAVLPAVDPLGADDRLERCFLEMVRYYRHSAVGRRCRGIVHQMNSPLQVLTLQLELLEQKTREEPLFLSECSPAAAENLRLLNQYRYDKLLEMRQELGKLQDFTRQIISQGIHEENQERMLLDLNQVVARELNLYLAQPFFKHQVDKDIRLDSVLPALEGHYIDFSQCFRNLVDNALEAMEGVERRKLTVQTSLEDNLRVLRVGDTGVGVPTEIMPLIFEPFFSTKGTVKEPRAGLGLFMARRLVAPYGGAITLESWPGETWVTVRLPVIRI